ncbi:ATP-grasp domain-containing protein [Streptomyces sp. SLBN-118]|uniref:ATP-grasp domain-containing protein n=1 Tax=Streptomyces sp. SLBN-118 TaxID=2768454 RepID=UPI001154D4BC|nr:ATP-grasp domain-containing protein [Streptomyces sp. SLBN-118]TQK45456.1 ATP-grasp domain-containing protein [Streptomyces sp. SLBN-118]
MSESLDVLILSKRSVGGVRHLAELLRKSGRRPVLLSENAEDMNRGACDAHVVVDWAADGPERAVAAIDAAGVVPTAVVNLVDPLVQWQAWIARHYGLPGGEPAREVLVNKARVREEMHRLGLSDLWFGHGAAGSYPVEEVPAYPVIVKPCTDSGSSRLVRRADDAEQLRAALRDICGSAGPEFEVIVEEYVAGTEISIDGPLIDGRFRGLLHVEKCGRDEARNHDTGILHSPVRGERLTRGAELVERRITALCTDLGLDRGWLHVEARIAEDGAAELIEINPRVAGGMHPAAITHTCGLDAVEEMLLMALGQEDLERLRSAARSDELIGMVHIEPDRMGRVTEVTPLERMKELPGVLDGYIWDDFEVWSLDNENFFAAFMVTGGTEPELAEAADRVHREFSFRVG